MQTSLSYLNTPPAGSSPRLELNPTKPPLGGGRVGPGQPIYQPLPRSSTDPIPTPHRPIPEIASGKVIWARHFGDIGEEPRRLPSNINEILASTCPFWPESKVRETHVLVLMPSEVDGQPYHLDGLVELIKYPNDGKNRIQCAYGVPIQRSIGNQSIVKPYWALMTKQVVPGTKNRTFEEQLSIVQSKVPNFSLLSSCGPPTALEAATCLSMELMRTGTNSVLPLRLEAPISDKHCRTNCQEQVSNQSVFVGDLYMTGNNWLVGIGLSTPHPHIGTGLACVWRLTQDALPSQVRQSAVSLLTEEELESIEYSIDSHKAAYDYLNGDHTCSAVKTALSSLISNQAKIKQIRASAVAGNLRAKRLLRSLSVSVGLEDLEPSFEATSVIQGLRSLGFVPFGHSRKITEEEIMEELRKYLRKTFPTRFSS